jgi:cytochrome c oxidase subunit IV
MSMENAHAGANSRLFLIVWLYLLVITAVEVVLAYLQLFRTEIMLLILMILSAVKAGLIIAYFMHLRFEKPSLILSIIPVGMLVVALLFAFFPDSFRVLELRPQ